MRALSLWQPHAAAIAAGLKKYETRGWPTNYRGPVAIHAAKRQFTERDGGPGYYKLVGELLESRGFPLGMLDYGRLVCVADVVSCEQAAKVGARLPPSVAFWGDFSEIGEDGRYRYAWELKNVRVISWGRRPELVGRQGFFEVSDKLVELCLAGTSVPPIPQENLQTVLFDKNSVDI